MKKLFMWLLSKYSNNEKDRISILAVLNDKITDEYREQTTYGNVYNYFIEFIMANDFIVNLAVTSYCDKELSILKKGINTAFDESIEIIKNRSKHNKR